MIKYDKYETSSMKFGPSFEDEIVSNFIIEKFLSQALTKLYS